MEPSNVIPTHIVDDEVDGFARWTGLEPDGLPDVMRHYQDRSSPHHEAATECLHRIVETIKAYCAERGVTKYSHWFNSWTDSPAYKRDSLEFLSPETLFQGEPDASSKPTGGLRSTYEARGYTVWDSKAPLFVLNGTTLCVPTLFISYNGEALDVKSPALRAKEALGRAVRHFLDVVDPGAYDWSEVKVRAFGGPEQEYFLVPQEIAAARPDLTHTGATVLGKAPPRNQQLEEHYLGSIPVDVHAFFEELNDDLASLGIVPATDHNEVAPRQFEFAPYVEEAVRSCDFNLLVLHTLREVAARHGWMAVTHEKPFAGLNGSGKHLNFSVGVVDRKTGDLIDNLHAPPMDPGQRLTFLVFLGATVAGFHRRARLLRGSVASRSNDQRLGGHEAPPSVISVYLGETIQQVSGELFGVDTSVDALSRNGTLDLALEGVPLVARHHTDRNRTSPVAFTGNKFEFRMPGSDSALFMPLTVMLAAVAEVVEEVAVKLESQLQERDRNAVLLDAFTELMREADPVVFDGDCYSAAWREEAERRGLPEAKDTATALEVFIDPEQQSFLDRLGIWTQDEANAFYSAKMDEYAKEVAIETGTLLDMVKTGIRPAAQTYQTELGSRVDTMGKALEVARSASGAPADALASQLGHAITDLATFGELVARLDEQTAALDSASDELMKIEDEAARGRHAAAAVVTAAATLRETCDDLEGAMPRDLYPFPTCSDLLQSFG